MKQNSTDHPVVSQEAWLKASRTFLKQEKELTRQKDLLAAQRRKLPWVKIDKDYVFDAPKGKVGLAELFEGRSQLIVYHFMLGPGWGEGCVACAFVADHLAPSVPHLKAMDISFCAISKAPISEIAPFKKRMGWTFPWVSSFGNSFNHDFNVSFTPEEMASGKVDYNSTVSSPPHFEEMQGLSVFVKDDSGIYRTYSSYARGVDHLIGAYTLADLTPKGRSEEDDSAMEWLRYHDMYESAAVAV